MAAGVWWGSTPPSTPQGAHTCSGQGSSTRTQTKMQQGQARQQMQRMHTSAASVLVPDVLSLGYKAAAAPPLHPTHSNPYPTNNPHNTLSTRPPPRGTPSPCQQAVFECAPHHGKQWPMPQVLAHTTSHCLQFFVSSIHRGTHQGTNLFGFRV